VTTPVGPASPPLELGALWRSLPGRLVLVSSVLLGLLLAAGRFGDLPFAFDLLRRIVWISWLVGSGWLAGLALLRNWHVLLWRVRRKLLLSYVFFGVVPVVLVLAFGLAASVLLYVTVVKYVFLESYDDTVRAVRDIAGTSAIEVGRTPSLDASGLERRYENLRERYPGLSLALVPARARPAGVSGPVLAAGAWAHMPAPASAPDWLAEGGGGFSGTLVRPGDGGEPQLVIRAAVPTADGTRVAIADLPVGARFTATLRAETGISIGPFQVSGCEAGEDPAARPVTSDRGTLFRETVAFLDCSDWTSGAGGRVAITLVAPVRELYARLAAFNLSPDVASLANWASVLLQLLWLLGVLFLIIQASAIVMGSLLAKSITFSVHELFEGTERVRQGDFAHRIRIESRDQLGELAGSFNRMSESIEHLLHVQREKQRLDDELRIAREIQKSLLPVQPPVMAGLDIADLCEPAREVGGDYYDFFELGPRQLGVMIADVSGKGTSAALYMAELKGIMLALSRADRSPRNVLVEVNRLLAAHLDNRSFITMTYAVIDLDRGRVTVARAGHTPMIVVSGGRSDVVVPEGIVLGLRLPGSDALFEQVLQEQELPLVAGDVLVLYTDGITEAANMDGEMFGDEALARVVAGHHALGATGIRERVVREVAAFVGSAEAHDDMTMVVIRVAEGTARS
jgi:serine phosphatase RsbU (regulator of sigma subunit)